MYWKRKRVLEIFSKWQINPRSIITWMEKEVIIPAKESADIGGVREYNFKNLIQIGILAELLYYGVPVKKMKYILNHHNVKTKLDAAEKSGDYDFIIYFRRQIGFWPDKTDRSYQVAQVGVECFETKDFKPDPSKYASGLNIHIADIWTSIKESL